MLLLLLQGRKVLNSMEKDQLHYKHKLLYKHRNFLLQLLIFHLLLLTLYTHNNSQTILLLMSKIMGMSLAIYLLNLILTLELNTRLCIQITGQGIL